MAHEPRPVLDSVEDFPRSIYAALRAGVRGPQAEVHLILSQGEGVMEASDVYGCVLNPTGPWIQGVDQGLGRSTNKSCSSNGWRSSIRSTLSSQTRTARGLQTGRTLRCIFQSWRKVGACSRFSSKK